VAETFAEDWLLSKRRRLAHHEGHEGKEDELPMNQTDLDQTQIAILKILTSNERLTSVDAKQPEPFDSGCSNSHVVSA